MRFRSSDGHYYIMCSYTKGRKMVECGREELDDIVGRFTLSRQDFWKMIDDEDWVREERQQ